MSTSPSTLQGTPLQQRLLLTKHAIEPIVKKVAVIKKGATLQDSSKATTYHKSPSSQVHSSNPACSDKKVGSEVKKHITEVYRRRRSVDTDYSFLDSDLAPMVREESRTSQKKRVLLKEELHEDSGESRKGVKKLKVDRKDKGKPKGQSTDTEEVKDKREFAVTTIVEVNLPEDKTVENAKKKNKKNKNAGERHADQTVLSQRGRLQQLVHGQGKRKGVEKNKTEVVDTETSPPEKRRHLTKQGRKLEKQILGDKTEVIDSVKDGEVEASNLFFEKSEVEKDQHVRKEEELNLKSAQSIKSISCQGNSIVKEHPADANASNTAAYDSASLMPSSSKEVTDYPEISILPNEISSDDLQLEKVPDLVNDRTGEVLEGSDENKNITSNRHHMAVKKVMVKKYSVLKPKQKTSSVQNNLEKHGEAVKYKARHPPKTTCDEGDLVPDGGHLPDTDLVSTLEVLDFATKLQPPDELPGMETEVSTKFEHDAGFDFSRGAQANSTASEVLIRPQVKKGHERLKKAKCHTGEKVVLAERKNGSFASAKSSYPLVEAREGVLQETLKRIKPNSRKPSGAVSTGDLVKKIEGSEEVVASKNLLASPISLDCARCSINGWVWRSWARERAKKRLQSGVKTAGRKVMKDELPKLRKTKKMETNVVYKKTFDSVASLQAARQNRATLRKLAFASEGSDMLRFNLHKVGK